jgi:group I intron endonuclease
VQVYLITNLLNGCCYVGKATDFQVRWQNHLKLAKRGKGYHLHAAIRQYGVDSFTISLLVQCTSDSEAFEQEKRMIEDLKLRGVRLYNESDGGKGPVGFKHSESSKLKISLALQSKSKPKLVRQRIARSLKGRTFSETHRKNLSVKAVGHSNSQFGKKWVSNGSVCKLILSQDIQSFIADGWVFGRC